MNLSIEQIDALQAAGEISLSQAITLKLKIDNPAIGTSVLKTANSFGPGRTRGEVTLNDAIVSSVERGNFSALELIIEVQAEGYEFPENVPEDSPFDRPAYLMTLITAQLKTTFDAQLVSRVKGISDGRKVFIYETYKGI